MNASGREKNQGKKKSFWLPDAFFIISLCFAVCAFSPAVFALDAGQQAVDDFGEMYLLQGKTMVIYKGQAPDAGDEHAQIQGEGAVSRERDIPPQGTENAVTIEADSMGYDNARDAYHARGKVKIFYSGAALYADDVEVNKKDNLATAQGNAFLKMGEDTLRGEKIIFNIQDRTGAAYQADAFYARNNFYIRGEKIEKTGENTYFIKEPSATTCNGESPDWQITGKEMKVTIEGYGTVKSACFRTKGIPILYTPYVIFPAKTRRQTGFLLPRLAYSRDKDGLDIELPFFWAISPQMDATLYPRYIEKRGFRPGAEFRYYWGEHSFGTLYGDYLEDDRHITETADSVSRDWQDTHKRWSYYFNHQTDFSPDFYVRADLKKVSDPWYFKDFSAHNYYADHYARDGEDDFKKVSFLADESLRYLESSVRIVKGWSNFSLTGLMDSTEDFGAANNDRTLQRYPQVVLTGAKQRLFNTPLYYDLTGNYNYLYREQGDKGHYVELTPSVSLPLNLYNYLRFTPRLAFRETFWSRDDDGAEDESGGNAVFNASVSLSSQLSRVYDAHGMGWEKVRHDIKPEIIYSYVPNVSRDDLPDFYGPAFSPLDRPVSLFSGDALAEQNALGWSLTNTLTARMRDEKGMPRYLEFLRLKIYQAYDINEAKKSMDGVTGERRPFSDMGIELDVSPHEYFSFKSRNVYNYYDGWKQNNVDMRLKDRRNDALSVGYRYTMNSLEEIGIDLKAVVTPNIEGRFVWRRDLENDRLLENTIGVMYQKQCWSVGMDYTKTEDDVRFLFKISLLGLGKTGMK
ncbi:MAG TPA: LPS assembly protein LptD [Smithella sp.]|nr:LPS assembly protein LptD [Smithella sp.]